MNHHYTPRRAGKKRWLEGAPEYVLDVLDSKGPGERYTVLFAGSLLIRESAAGNRRGRVIVPFLGMSDAPSHPQGVSMWGEMDARDAAAYRYRCGKERIRWLDLPEHIRAHVIARAT